MSGFRGAGDAPKKSPGVEEQRGDSGLHTTGLTKLSWVSHRKASSASLS